MRRLAILGAGGHGRVVADAASTAGTWDCIEFYDREHRSGSCAGPWPVVGNELRFWEVLNSYTGVVIGIGDNEIRHSYVSRVLDEGGPLVSIVHASACIAQDVHIGVGSVVFAGAIINTGAKLGEGVIVNTGAIIEHDCSIGVGVHLSPQSALGGGVNVGDLSWVGIGACVKQLVVIGSRAKVGAGSVVLNSVKSATTVVGCPAQKIADRA